MPYQQRSKLQQQDYSRGITLSQKQVLTCQFLAVHDLATHSANNVKFLGRSHAALGLNLKQYCKYNVYFLNIVLIRLFFKHY